MSTNRAFTDNLSTSTPTTPSTAQQVASASKQGRFTFTGTYTGFTGQAQVSNDGTNYVSILAQREDTGATFNGTVSASNFSIICNIANWGYFRFLPSAIASGTVVCVSDQGQFALPPGVAPISVGSLAQTITGSSANTLAVGPNGTTNPTVNVDCSAGSCATGWNHVGAAAASGAALKVISSGTDENGTIDAKGSGTLTFGSVSTGNIVMSRLLNLALGVTASAATFPITGQVGSSSVGGAMALTGGAGNGAFNGGAITVTGGASGAGATGAGGALTFTGGAAASTNGAGGAGSLIGGAGTGTGAGGAVAVTGGAGGAGATGNGGAAAVTGGAATSTNGVGGAITVTGGLGTGTQAGGAVTITSGAAGATGVAGVVSIAVGAATAGNGSALTLTGGNGAGGTNSGGNVNIIPGTAVSTGTPGELTVNSVAGVWEANWQQFLAANVPVSGTSYPMYLATRAMRVKAVKVCCSSTSTQPTVDVTKDTGTTAPGAGTTVLTGAISFSATANTVVSGTLTSTVATLTMAAGDRLSLKWGGTVGSITGAVVNVLLVPC